MVGENVGGRCTEGWMIGEGGKVGKRERRRVSGKEGRLERGIGCRRMRERRER